MCAHRFLILHLFNLTKIKHRTERLLGTAILAWWGRHYLSKRTVKATSCASAGLNPQSVSGTQGILQQKREGLLRLHSWVGSSLSLNTMLWEIKLGYSTRSDFSNELSSVTTKTLPWLLWRGSLPHLGNWKPGQGSDQGLFREKGVYVHMQHLLQELKGLGRTRIVLPFSWVQIKYATCCEADRALAVALKLQLSLLGTLLAPTQLAANSWFLLPGTRPLHRTWLSESAEDATLWKSCHWKITQN